MAPGLAAHYRRRAALNRLANERLFAACARLTVDQRGRDMGAFFDSIHGTLNQIMVGDRIWMARFAGETVPSVSLDATLYEDFNELTAARTADDARIETFFKDINAAIPEGTNADGPVDGVEYDDRLTVQMPHLFNHQTHHRGQIHAMITRFDRSLAPVLDMHRVLIPEPGTSLA